MWVCYFFLFGSTLFHSLVAISEPKKVSICRPPPLKWPLLWICPLKTTGTSIVNILTSRAKTEQDRQVRLRAHRPYPGGVIHGLIILLLYNKNENKINRKRLNTEMAGKI